MDELQHRRERRDDQNSSRDVTAVVRLSKRDREAHRQEEVSDVRDEVAKVADRDADARDRLAEQRDAEAVARDANGSIATPASADERRRALRAREEAAYDREQSVDDRVRARRDRKVSQQGRERAVGDRSAAWEAIAAIRVLVSDAEIDAEDMLLIGRAQGIIMHERGLPPTEALLELCVQARQNETSLAGASHAIVADMRP